MDDQVLQVHLLMFTEAVAAVAVLVASMLPTKQAVEEALVVMVQPLRYLFTSDNEEIMRLFYE
jgi:hypothetical protein